MTLYIYTYFKGNLGPSAISSWRESYTPKYMIYVYVRMNLYMYSHFKGNLGPSAISSWRGTRTTACLP